MTAVKAPWVKWFAGDFLSGIIGLQVEEIGVYTVILNMIYDSGGPIREDINRLALRCGMRPTSFLKVLMKLEGYGKVLRHDGVISNPRAEKELESRVKVVQKLKENFLGRDRTETEKDNKNNGSKSANGAANQGAKASVELELELELERKKVRKVGAAAPRPPSAPLRATRIDPQLKLPESWRLYARSKGLTDRETKFNFEKFLAHYKRLNGSKALSVDWEASWQSWVLGSVERLGRDPAPPEADGGYLPMDPKTFTREQWLGIIKLWRGTSHWHPDNGPAPGERGCVVPKGLLDNP